MDLKKILNPSSIAIVGVSHESKKVGHLVAKNLIAQGYEGKVYFINNKFKGKILGKKTHRSLSEITTPKIDLVVLAVPADIAIIYLEELQKLDIHQAVIYAAGFKEAGEAGSKREELLKQKAKEYDITLFGPNCLGYVNTKKSINLTFLKTVVPSGNIGFVSQSGALGSMMVDHYVSHRNLGFSYFMSLGNKTVIDESDCLEFLVNDKDTKVIAMYLEDVKDGEKFKRTIQKVTKIKPVVLLKSGSTEEGSKAALSHTGGLAGNDQIYNALFNQYGVIRAVNMTEFLTILKILSFQRIPASKNILVLSNAGGIGVLLADELIKNNLHLITISEKTKKDIEGRMGEWHKITLHNPIDILGDAGAFDYRQVIEATMKEKDIGCIIVLLTPQANTEIHQTAKVIADAQKKFNKPIYPLFMGEKSIEGSHLYFEEHKIAGFYKYDYLPQSLSKIIRWKEYLSDKEYVTSPHLLKLSLMANENEIAAILKESANKPFLNLLDSMDLLRFIDIPTASYIFLENSADISNESGGVNKIINKVGFPCVLKAVSDTITHKTEADAVVTNIHTTSELEHILRLMKKRFSQKELKGFFLQQMKKGYEMFIGAKRDPAFGIVLLAGIGGIYAELFKEISFRIYPFSYDQFLFMVSETKLSRLIRGFRGTGIIDAQKLYEIVIKIGLLMEKFPQIKEIDMNPLIISDTSIAAVDCRIIL